MFIFDIETSDTESTAVILSISIVYIDPKETVTYQQLLDKTLFVKLDVSEQVEKHERTVGQATIEWWAKQPKYIRDQSMKPSDKDVSCIDALNLIRKYINKYSSREDIVWARGSLDSLCIESLTNVLGEEPLFPYYMWRDIRTAIDILYGSTNGYCDVKDFDRNSVPKHLPYHDVCLDAMMLLYGKSKDE